MKTTVGRLRAQLGDPPVIQAVRESGYRILPFYWHHEQDVRRRYSAPRLAKTGNSYPFVYTRSGRRHESWIALAPAACLLPKISH